MQKSQADTPALPHLCVVVPAFDEEAVLPVFHQRLTAVLNELPGFDWEILYINDGSRDQTLTVMQTLESLHDCVSVLDLSRNYGKEIALTAGLDHARHADAVIVIDADLQDPPELIPRLIEGWQAGNDVVFAQRTRRNGETMAKRATAHVFYRLMQYLGEHPIPQDTGDFRLLNRRAVRALTRMRERHRFMKGLFTLIGFRQLAIPYERAPRQAGETKWNYWKLWNFALEGITSFSIAPLKVATYFGTLVAGFAMCFAVFIIIKTLLFGDPVQGYPTIMVTILFLGGVQLMAIGILGEYVGRIFDETKRRPLYFLNSYQPGKQKPQPRPSGHSD